MSNLYDYQKKIVKNIIANGGSWVLHEGRIYKQSYARSFVNLSDTSDHLEVMKVEYTGLDNIRHSLTYFEEGPSGSRWVDENNRIVTIDLVETKDKGVLNPWDNAQYKMISWVTK
jgi:hypothetical protein